ncbi:MAG: 2'-5' RNA ligase family protein [Jatrophihabitantaceae bacterium]
MSERFQHRDFSGLVITLPDLDPVVGRWRSRFHNYIKQLPTHVTLLAPWIPPAEITEDDLRLVAELAKQWARFEVSFSRLQAFEPTEPDTPAVHWLAPEPDEPFRQLIDDLATTWPEYPPYEGAHGNDPTPHLTVANAVMTDDETTALLADLAARLPVSTVAAELSVLEVIDGSCRIRAGYPLAGKSGNR